MELNIRGDKITVTKSIKDYITEKMERLNKYFEGSKNIKASVIIRVRNNEQIIEVTVPTSKFTLRAEEKHADLYAAIDLVMDKLERQIRKNKTRLNDRYKNVIQFDVPVENDEDEEEDLKIVKRKHPPLRKTIGFFYKCAVFLPRILPTKLVNFIVRKMYL